jgi:hypothetical protein
MNNFNIRASVLADARSRRPDLARLSDEAFIDRALSFFSDNSSVRPPLRNHSTQSNLSVVPPMNPVDELTARKRAVYGYFLKRGVPLNARAIQQGRLTLLEGYNADDIRALLNVMKDDGFLRFDGKFYDVIPNNNP